MAFGFVVANSGPDMASTGAHPWCASHQAPALQVRVTFSAGADDSTATLNPMSLSFCIPPGSQQPLYIPVLFNNSSPDEVSCFVRALDTGHAELKKISGSSMKKAPHHSSASGRLEIADVDEDGCVDVGVENPLSAMLLHGGAQAQELDVAKLPSIKPQDSLSVIPKRVQPTEQLLFLQVDRPSVVTLKSAVDKRGDRFKITPGKEAVIIECPTGGHFADGGTSGKKRKEGKEPAELRCVGDEEVVYFEARGVGPLTASWRKKSRDTMETGIIEGIEDGIDEAVPAEGHGAADQLALVHKEKVSRTHLVPLRVTHQVPGVHTVSITSVSDSMRNTYVPIGSQAEKVFNVISRPSAKLDCASSPIRLLKDKTTSIPIVLDGSGPLTIPLEATYVAKTPSGETTHSVRMTKRVETLQVSEPGTYTLMDISGQCAGSVLEPSVCVVQLVPQPTMDMSVTTLHECAMDVGVTASFEFQGEPPFGLEYTEQRKGSRAVRHQQRFKSHHGQITLQPDQEGEYTYIFDSISDRNYQRIKLDKPPIEQNVHPLANIELLGRGEGPRRKKLFACSGDTVDFELDAKVSNLGSVPQVTSAPGGRGRACPIDLTHPLPFPSFLLSSTPSPPGTPSRRRVALISASVLTP